MNPERRQGANKAFGLLFSEQSFIRGSVVSYTAAPLRVVRGYHGDRAEGQELKWLEVNWSHVWNMRPKGSDVRGSSTIRQCQI